MYLYRIKKIRLNVWLPNPIKLKYLDLFFKLDSNFSKLADLHFFGINCLDESFSISVLRKLAYKSDVIFDIGANIGLITLILSDSNPNAQIYSFEPSSYSFPILVDNINLNKFKNINSLKLGIGSNDSKQLFYTSSVNHVISSFTPREGFIEEQIEVKTLKSFCDDLNIEKIDLIKIDVEGYESDVIAGLGEKIFNSKPIIFAEVLNETCGEKIIPFLPKKYIYFRVFEEKKVLVEDKKINRTSKKSNNYLFVHLDKLSILKELSLI